MMTGLPDQCQGLKPTYKELKLAMKNKIIEDSKGLKPTYKELKLETAYHFHPAQHSLKPTYKELKRLCSLVFSFL